MPNEPERPIEKLLRACGRKRREEAREAAGFELHPATRRMLQGEVARRFRKREQARGRDTWRWRASFWPRLVEACVLVTLMAVVASVLIPAFRHSPKETRLAKNEADQKALPAAPATPAPAAAPPIESGNQMAEQSVDRDRVITVAPGTPGKQLAPAPRQGSPADTSKEIASASGGIAGLSGGGGGPAQRRFKMESSTASAPPAPAESPMLADNGLKASPSQNRPAANAALASLSNAAQLSLAQKKAPALAYGAPAPAALDGLGVATNGMWNMDVAAAPAAGATFAWKDAENRTKADQPIVLQNFQQVMPDTKARANVQSQAGSPVLASFQVQQMGRELRVIDSDGSVYTGSVLPTETAKRKVQADSLASPKAAPSAPSGLQPALALSKQAAASGPAPQQFFRVTGTNRSLNQAVVFSGNWSLVTNSVVNDKLQGDVTGNTAGEPSPSAGRLLNARIWGQAVVGTNQVLQINAVPGP